MITKILEAASTRQKHPTTVGIHIDEDNALINSFEEYESTFMFASKASESNAQE